MKFCVDVPNFGVWSDPRRFAEFARRVEAAGWDGISVWDHILVWDGAEVADPWFPQPQFGGGRDHDPREGAQVRQAELLGRLGYLLPGGAVLPVNVGWIGQAEGRVIDRVVGVKVGQCICIRVVERGNPFSYHVPRLQNLTPNW